MGYKDGCEWDDRKGEILEELFAISFSDCVNIVLDDSTPLISHPAYPEQLRALGKIRKKLFTIAFIEHKDFLIRIITAWPSSAAEKKAYYKQGGK